MQKHTHRCWDAISSLSPYEYGLGAIYSLHVQHVFVVVDMDAHMYIDEMRARREHSSCPVWLYEAAPSRPSTLCIGNSAREGHESSEYTHTDSYNLLARGERRGRAVTRRYVTYDVIMHQDHALSSRDGMLSCGQLAVSTHTYRQTEIHIGLRVCTSCALLPS